MVTWSIIWENTRYKSVQIPDEGKKEKAKFRTKNQERIHKSSMLLGGFSYLCGVIERCVILECMDRNKKDKLFTSSFIVACTGNFLLFLGFYLLLPVLPLYLMERFHSTKSEVGCILACYTVAALAVRPFAGFIADKFSRKPVYLLSYALFTAVFISYPLVETVLLFLFIRVLHGLTFGMVTTAGNTLIVDIMPASRRGEGLGYFGVANNLAMAVGPMVGLMLHDVVHSFDLLFYSALFCGILGFLFASRIKAPQKVKCASEPLSMDRFFLAKGLNAGFCLMLLAIPYGITTSYVALYAREIGVAGSMGLFFSLMAAGLIVSRTFAGGMIDRGKLVKVITIGTTIVMVAFFVFTALTLLPAGDVQTLSVVFFIVPILLGLGYGMVFPSYNTLFVNLAPHNRRATASSTYLTSWDIGIGLGLLFGGSLADLSGFPVTYFVGAVLVLISVLFFVWKTAPHYEQNKFR
jgi:MFS family permease